MNICEGFKNHVERRWKKECLTALLVFLTLSSYNGKQSIAKGKGEVEVPQTENVINLTTKIEENTNQELASAIKTGGGDNNASREINDILKQQSDIVIEKIFGELGILALGEGKDPNGLPQCMNDKVLFEISPEDLQKYPELNNYYDKNTNEVHTTMGVLLNIVCQGENIYEYIPKHVDDFIKKIIETGMLKNYQNANSQIKSGMRVNWRILLHSSNLTQHEILKINMDNIPPIDFIDLIQGYCERDFTVQPYFIQTCFDKIDISQLTNEDKKELLEMYALIVYDGQWNGNFVIAFGNFMNKVFPQSEYDDQGESTDQGEITEDIAKILGISSYSYLFRYICQLQESIRLNPKTDKAEKYEKELRRVLWIWCELTHTITWGQTTQMTQVTQE